MKTTKKIKRAFSRVHPKTTLKQAGSLVEDLQEVLTAAKDVYDAIYKHTHGKSLRQGALAVSRAWNREMHGDMQGSMNGKATRRGAGANGGGERASTGGTRTAGRGGRGARRGRASSAGRGRAGSRRTTAGSRRTTARSR
jgi:hypothetical protein